MNIRQQANAQTELQARQMPWMKYPELSPQEWRGGPIQGRDHEETEEEPFLNGHWYDRIIAAFGQYADKHQNSLDVCEDFMDFTVGSSLVKSLSSGIHDLLEPDAPTLASIFAKLEELKQLIHGNSLLKDLRNVVYGIPLKTEVRRFLYASVQGYTKYFPHHSHLPDKDERQLMTDVVGRPCAARSV
ncbi:hypothetical protein BGX30_002520 [Mortierella sp. GBA39]|nr:hypothetical protein BGX30_002520 [Mortierella sp. GBA39]